MELHFYITLASTKIMCKFRQERVMVGIQDEGPASLLSNLLQNNYEMIILYSDKSTIIQLQIEKKIELTSPRSYK